MDKIKKLTYTDNTGIGENNTGALKNFQDIENTNQPLSGSDLDQSQNSLAIKINQIIDALDTIKDEIIFKLIDELPLDVTFKTSLVNEMMEDKYGLKNKLKDLLKLDSEFILLTKGEKGENGDSSGGIQWVTDNYADVADFWNKSKNYEMVKSDIDKEGHAAPDGLLILAKVGSDLKQFWTMEAAKSWVKSQLLILQQDIGNNVNEIAKLKNTFGSISNEINGLKHRMDGIDTKISTSEHNISTNTSEINAIKSHGINIPHLEVTTPLTNSEIDMKLKALVTNVADGDVAYVGANSNWVLWKYSASDTKWVKTGNGSQHSTTTIDAYTKDEVNAELVKKANIGLSYNKSESDNKYATKAALSDKADIAAMNANITGLTNKINSKADASAVYTKSESDTIFATKTDLGGKVDVSLYNTDIPPMQFSIQSYGLAIANKVNKDLRNVTGWTQKEIQLPEISVFTHHSPFTVPTGFGSTVLWGNQGEPNIENREELLSMTLHISHYDSDPTSKVSETLHGVIKDRVGNGVTNTTITFNSNTNSGQMILIMGTKIASNPKWTTTIPNLTIESIDIHYIKNKKETVLVKNTNTVGGIA